MREIRFRGKRTDNGGWAYGDLVRYYENQRRFIVYDQLAYMYKECGIDRLVSERFFEVNPDTVGQYTGLLDKNGKEIFEGDIVQSEFDGDLETVYFDEKTLQFNTTDRWLWMLRGRLEVIGNIHENPELLEAME